MHILKLYTTWCGPCKQLSKLLEEIKPDCDILSYDVDVAKGLVDTYKVRGVPLMIAFSGETELGRMSGLQSRVTIETWIDEMKVLSKADKE